MIACGADEVADADARADRLGERRRVDDLARVVLREHRRQRLALEADRDVRVVLEDREVVLGREPQQLAALLRAQRVAGRVLEVGDDVRELRLDAAGEQRAERGRVDPVRLQLDHVQVGAAVAQVEQRAVVGRRLDDDGVARVDEQLEEERVGLHRAVGDEHLLDGDAVLLGDPLAQRHVADRRAVRDRPAGILLEGELRGLAQPLHVDDVERRRAPGERDRVGHGLRRYALSGRASPRCRPAISATSVGVWPTRTPRASSASCLAFAVPAVPETIAPAWPIVLPGGAVKPAM